MKKNIIKKKKKKKVHLRSQKHLTISINIKLEEILTGTDSSIQIMYGIALSQTDNRRQHE